MESKNIKVLSSIEINKKDGRLVFENASFKKVPVEPNKLIEINKERKSIKGINQFVENALGRRIGR